MLQSHPMVPWSESIDAARAEAGGRLVFVDFYSPY
jgi:hypothetical protein